MARFVQFSGQTLYHPGGLTKVNANALTPVGLSLTGVVQLLGEAEGGPPGSEGVVTIDDPALAKDIFRSGPLADAVRVAFQSSGDPRIPGGATRVLAYKTNASTQSSTQLPGDSTLISDTVDSGSTTTAIEVVTGGLVVDAHIGRWLAVGGELRRIVDNDADTITVSPGFSVAPTSGSAVIRSSELEITSVDYGLHTSQVSVEFEAGDSDDTSVVTVAFEDTIEQSPEIGGSAYLRIKYVGGAAETNGTGSVTSATASTVTLNTASAPTSNQFANMVIRFADGTQRLITSNTAADPTVITLTTGYGLTTAEIASITGGSATVVDVLSATVSIIGTGGAATGLTSAVTPNADNLAITFPTGMTLRQLVDLLNGTTNYEAEIPAGINPDTTLMADFDYGTRATAVDVRFDDAITPADKGSFRQDLMVLVNWLNTYSSLVTAERLGSEIPVYTGGVASSNRDVPVYLIGGDRGISANSDLKSGFY